MSRPKRFNRSKASRTERCDKAKANDAAQKRRTPQQQMDLLDERLGKDVGAAKERARLLSLINYSM